MVLLTALPRMDLAFGQSNDGFNDSVWGADTRALREDGIVVSRLGGLRADGTTYANHPPLIVVTTAAVESVFGEHRWATRLVPLTATMAAMVLLFLLGLELGYHPISAGTGVLTAALTPMLLGFDTMLDTPVTSLPFGVAVLLLWQRRRRGRALPGWLEAIVAGLACLAGWQATLLVGGVAIAVAVAALRREATWRALGPAMPMLIGGVVGVAASVAWPMWVYDGVGPLFEQFVHRTGSDGSGSLAEAARFQAHQIRVLLGVAVVGLLGTFAALRRPSARAVAAASLLIVAAHIALFHQGALHDYWAYWVILPTAVGVAELAETARELLLDRPRAWTGALMALLALVLVTDALLPSSAAETDAGAAPAAWLHDSDMPSDQSTVAVVGAIVDADPWIGYETRRHSTAVSDVDDLAVRAAARPDDIALLVGSCAYGAEGDLCRSIWAAGTRPGTGNDAYRVATLAELETAARDGAAHAPSD